MENPESVYSAETIVSVIPNDSDSNLQTFGVCCLVALGIIAGILLSKTLFQRMRG